ncbi:MAG: tRNA epoxyqueuosine(34) reductase QueG [bacterium]
MNFKNRLVEHALENGFLDLKIAGAFPLDEEFVYFKQWLESGYHADMSYLERNTGKRSDVGKVLEKAKSVIVLSHPYFPDNSDYIPKKLKYEGKIALFAKGRDYHKVIYKKLCKVAKLTTEIHPDSQYKCYVDTGPILEKQWAVRSGIGWQGKNSLINNRKYGSYFFIGIIITTLELEPDKPIKDYCGTCTKCLDACPTKAIVEPKVIDARRCISYWTIECKSDTMPEEIRKNLSGWAYGCDICQDVCPWNKISRQKSEDRRQKLAKSNILKD